MENAICSTVAENFHQFAPEMLKQLVEGLDTAPPRYTVANAMVMEQTCFFNWLLDRVLALQKQQAGDDAKVMEGIHALCEGLVGPGEGQDNQGQPNLWVQVTKAAGGTSEGVLKLLREEEPLYRRIALIMALPYPQYEEQMKQFMAEIRESANPFVSISFPALEKTRPKEFAVLVQLAMVRAAMEYRSHGEPGLQSVTDPCGQGPFALERFVFEGVDRGFALKSAYAGRGFPEVLIFVEKDGPPFQVNGKNAGQPLPKSAYAK
jgi:hypothetical protein